MRVIGVTGGVGSGKSAVLNYIEAHFDARIVKADEVGHMLMMPWGKCYEPVVKLFGDWVVRGTALWTVRPLPRSYLRIPKC